MLQITHVHLYNYVFLWMLSWVSGWDYLLARAAEEYTVTRVPSEATSLCDSVTIIQGRVSKRNTTGKLTDLCRTESEDLKRAISK